MVMFSTIADIGPHPMKNSSAKKKLCLCKLERHNLHIKRRRDEINAPKAEMILVSWLMWWFDHRCPLVSLRLGYVEISIAERNPGLEHFHVYGLHLDTMVLACTDNKMPFRTTETKLMVILQTIWIDCYIHIYLRNHSRLLYLQFSHERSNKECFCRYERWEL